MSTLDEQRVYTEMLRDYLSVLKEYEVLDANQYPPCGPNEISLDDYVQKAKVITRKLLTLLDRALYPTIPPEKAHLSVAFAKSIFDILVVIERESERLVLRNKRRQERLERTKNG